MTIRGLVDDTTGAEVIAGDIVTRGAAEFAPIDANGIVTATNVVGDMTITVASGQTIALTRASKRRQMFTGTESVTVILPVVSTLELGFSFVFDSDTTGTVDVKSSGANAVVSLATDQWSEVSCRAITGTSAASWDVHRPATYSHSHNTASTSAAGFSPQATAPATGNLNVLAIGNGATTRTDQQIFTGFTREVVITEAAYAALSPPDSLTIYHITA